MRFRSCGLVLPIPILAALMQPLAMAQGSAESSTPATKLPAISNEELMMELRKLRSEVQETRRLKDQVIQLQNEMANLRSAPGMVPVQPGGTTPPGGTSVPVPRSGGGIGSAGGTGAGRVYRGGQPAAGASRSSGSDFATIFGGGGNVGGSGPGFYRGGQTGVSTGPGEELAMVRSRRRKGEFPRTSSRSVPAIAIPAMPRDHWAAAAIPTSAIPTMSSRST